MVWPVMIVMWAVIALLALLVVGLMREVGLMQLKVGAPQAMRNAQGVAIGARLDAREVRDWNGQDFTLPVAGTPNLVTFLSPTCGVCHHLIDPIRIVAKHERQLAVTVVCDGADDECREFLGQMDPAIRVVPDPGGVFKQSLGISSSSFGQVFDREAVAGPSGIVNNLAHLESLLRSFDPSGHVVIEGQVSVEQLDTRQPILVQEA